MTEDTGPIRDPRVAHAITEFQNLIRARYPEAVFELLEGDDPEAVFLRVVVDVDDLEPVRQLYRDRLVDLQVDEGLPLTLVSVRPVPRRTVSHTLRPTLPALPPRLFEVERASPGADVGGDHYPGRR